jgi:transposase
VAQLGLSAELVTTLTPLCRLIAALTTEVRALDARLQTRTASDPTVARLRTVPGIGLIVATSYRAFVDRHERFAHAGQVSAALGVVPREDSSAERRHRGHITKAGPAELRSLLVQAAWVCWRHPGSATLKAWADRLAARRGKRIAVVALARRLSRILYAIWRDGTTFDAVKLATA